MSQFAQNITLEKILWKWPNSMELLPTGQNLIAHIGVLQTGASPVLRRLLKQASELPEERKEVTKFSPSEV